MSIVREAGATAIVQFTVPYSGTWNSIAGNMLSPDMLYQSMNVYIRKGKLRTRPGLAPLNDTVFTHPVLGGAMAVTPTDKIQLAVTSNQLYTLSQSDTTWQLDTTLGFSIDGNPIDISFLETSSQYVALIASKEFQLKRWLDGSGAVAIADAPVAKSVCTAASRVVVLTDPHTIKWTPVLDYQTWPALATAKIAQSNDDGICVKTLGTLTFVIYKERSIYLARAQAGSDANAFNIQFIQTVEGPSGVNAVVDVMGTHMYMTKNGRVGVFDGTGLVQFIADGLWLHLQSDIDPQYAYRIFGVFDYRLHTVTFYYPRNGDAGSMKGMVVVNMPLAGSNIQKPAAFLGLASVPCTFGVEMRFNDQIDQSVMFSYLDSVGRSLLVDETATTDLDMSYSCIAQTGLFPLPDMRHHQVSIESFLERADGYGSVWLYPVTSDALENETGDVQYDHGSLLDLNISSKQEYTGFNTPCRFFGVRYEWQSGDSVRYGGAALYGRILA